jgi:hypothetical protein
MQPIHSAYPRSLRELASGNAPTLRVRARRKPAANPGPHRRLAFLPVQRQSCSPCRRLWDMHEPLPSGPADWAERHSHHSSAACPGVTQREWCPHAAGPQRTTGLLANMQPTCGHSAGEREAMFSGSARTKDRRPPGLAVLAETDSHYSLRHRWNSAARW